MFFCLFVLLFSFFLFLVETALKYMHLLDYEVTHLRAF